MSRYAMTLCRIFMVVFAAVSIHAQCVETMPVVERGPIAPDGALIASQCLESCPNLSSAPVFLRHWQDAWFLDWIEVWCQGANGGQGSVAQIPSTSTCWKCVEGCAGSNCPPGETCLPKPGVGGSDCQRYACADPTNYMVVENAQTGQPECRRRTSCPGCTPTSVTITGPTAIQPGTSCTWSVDVQSSCPSSSYIYHWYAGPQWVGNGTSYTGGKPNGTLNGYPWRVRVEVVYNGALVGSHEIQVRESANALACFY